MLSHTVTFPVWAIGSGIGQRSPERKYVPWGLKFMAALSPPGMSPAGIRLLLPCMPSLGRS